MRRQSITGGRTAAAILGGVLALAFTLDPRAALGAECVTLSSGNYADFAPPDTVPRVFFGDYILRNDRITAAVADPALVTGRSANRWSIANVGGGVIALAPRGGSRPTRRASLFHSTAPLTDSHAFGRMRVE